MNGTAAKLIAAFAAKEAVNTRPLKRMYYKRTGKQRAQMRRDMQKGIDGKPNQLSRAIQVVKNKSSKLMDKPKIHKPSRRDLKRLVEKIQAEKK